MFADKNTDQKKTIGSQRAQRPVLANSYPRPSALIRGLKPSRARRQAAKAPDCKSGTREFESHRALQTNTGLRSLDFGLWILSRQLPVCKFKVQRPKTKDHFLRKEVPGMALNGRVLLLNQTYEPL